MQINLQNIDCPNRNKPVFVTLFRVDADYNHTKIMRVAMSPDGIFYYNPIVTHYSSRYMLYIEQQGTDEASP